MNLRGLANSQTVAVNPNTAVELRVSSGYTTAENLVRSPVYDTPGAFTGSIAGSELTVTAVGAGRLRRGQRLAGGAIAAGTTILDYGTGTGGMGTYQLTGSQTVASLDFTTSLIVPAQIQSLGYRDLMQTEHLNLQGTRRAIYFYGAVEGIVRATDQGGDLVLFPDGTVWLSAMVLEHWPNWCKIAATLQNP